MLLLTALLGGCAQRPVAPAIAAAGSKAETLATLLVGEWSNHATARFAPESTRDFEALRMEFLPAGTDVAAVLIDLRRENTPDVQRWRIGEDRQGLWIEHGLGDCRLRPSSETGTLVTPPEGCALPIESAPPLHRRLAVRGDTLNIEEWLGEARAGPAPPLQRLLRYSGEARLHAAGSAARAADRDGPWLTARIDRIGDDGDWVPLRDERGTASQYAVELIRTPAPHLPGTEQLRLALVDLEANQRIAIAWSDAGAGQIGMDLGWFSVTLRRQRS